MKDVFKKIKKERVIYFILLGIIITAIFYTMIKDRKNSLFYNKTYDQNTPIMIEKNNKIGYISSNSGKFIIDPIYDYGERFYGGHTIVKVNKNNNNYYRIIDKNNVKKLEFETYVNYEYIREYNLWLIDGVLYDKNFLSYFNENYFMEYLSEGLFLYKNETINESGIIDYTNNILFKFKGTNTFVDRNDISKNNIVIRSGNYYYLCDIKDKEIIYKVNIKDYQMALFSDNIIKLYLDNKDTKYIVFKNNKVIYETTDKIEDLKLIDNYVVIDYGYNFLNNNKKQRFYYYNLEKEELIKEKPKFKENNKNEYGYELFYKNNKTGLKKDNKVILNASYDEIKFIQLDLYKYVKHIYNKELVLLYKGSKVELYNLRNNKVIETFNIKNNDYLQTIKDTPYIKVKKYQDNDNTKLILYNIITNKSIELEDFDSFYADTNYVIVKKGNISKYYNSKFEIIYEKKN